MKAAITGGTGYVGRLLTEALLQRGDEVWVISRSSRQQHANHPKLHYMTWSQLNDSPAALEGIDAIVNLAGESINRRWTAEGKEAILQSRLKAAHSVKQLVGSLVQKPVVVNASGISIYGTDGSKINDEWSQVEASDFLASVVEQWEAAADHIPAERLVKLRIGLVLGMKDGAFPKMLLPYRLWAGGRMGSGQQWIPWIHEDDMIRLILFCIDTPSISGPVNACAPEPLTNEDFGRTIGEVMGRPHWFPVPAWLLRTALGELSFLLLEGSRAVPRKALELGFTFRYAILRDALRQLLGRG
ncbi:TIGR01777 family oxidoreductase [Paenibacillus sp. R14(2021)]|uniref:TIGR01777 family oxidoreductase n=1 Tax=Paenibacillus sp. R14(2021) TaxID=2859228 RepID=UPI001C615EC9|nr:TIGR01777 family oxidoreductase [Paenibacillus sp. R14(2021)]